MKTSWLKWAVLAVIAAALFFLGFKCGSGNTTAGTVKRDTVPGQLKVIIDTHYVPKPYKVIDRQIITNIDTVPVLEQIDTSQIVIDYHRLRYYSDTVKIDYGSAIISDTVTENKITGRSVKATLQIPVIKETITLYQPKRNIVYFGLSAQGGPQNYLFAAGADLSLKTRNDRMYSAGVSLTRDNQVLYGIGVKFPIRLRVLDKR